MMLRPLRYVCMYVYVYVYLNATRGCHDVMASEVCMCVCMHVCMYV